MTAKQGLEVLQGRSAAALRQRDLVGLAVSLARVDSPNKAYQRTLAHGWPARLAKSVQSLAALRRDHGFEAFKAFVSTFEHARSLICETEHAQEQVMNRESIIRSVSLLTVSVQKLRLLIKHGLLPEAEKLVEELVAGGEVSFWYCTNSCIRAARLLESVDKSTAPEPRLQVMLSPQGVTAPREENNPLTPETQGNDSVCIFLDELTVALNWNAEKEAEFVRRLLVVTSKRELLYRHPDCIDATAKAASLYLSKEDALLVRIELLVFRTRFREGELYRMANYLGLSRTPAENLQEMTDRTVVAPDFLCRIVAALVERFRQLGLSEQQVKDEFLWWLKNRPGTWPSWIYCLASAPCFSEQDNDARHKALRSYLPELFSYAILHSRAEWSLAHVAALGEVGVYRRTSGEIVGDESFFRVEFLKYLSDGRAGIVLNALLALGDVAGLSPATRWEVKGGTTAAVESLNLLAPEAFQKAFDEQRFGVAAALAKTFKCFPAGTRDRKEEAIQHATNLGQVIELAAQFTLPT
jgi:hypothetical protein